MARVLASALNCVRGPTAEPCGECTSCTAIARGEDLDVLEIDGASNTGVDNIRELRSNARYAPARSRFKIYYVDEVHMLSKSAFNALLKTLEEPPGHVKFIFSTTEPHRIPETIHSRCQRFDFRSIPPKAVAEQLARILKAEDLEGDEAVLAALARRSKGSLRDALSLLDQLISATGAATDLEALERLLGLADREQIEAMGRAMAARDPALALEIIERLVSDGRSLGEFLSLFVEHLREALLLAACGPDTELVTVREAARPAAQDLAGAVGTHSLLYAMQLCAETQRRLARASDERLPVEMAMVKLCTGDAIVPLADLVSRLDRLSDGPSGSGARRPMPRGPAPGGGRRPSHDNNPGAGRRPSAGDTDPPGKSGGGPSASAALEAPPADEPPQGSGGTTWDAAIQAVAERRRRLAGILRKGEVLSLDDDSLVLGFRPDQRLLVDQLNEAETKSFIEARMQEAFGRQIRLQFAEAHPSIATADEPSAAAPVGDESALRERALADPIVGSAVGLFGARLVRVRPAPNSRPTLEETPPA